MSPASSRSRSRRRAVQSPVPVPVPAGVRFSPQLQPNRYIDTLPEPRRRQTFAEAFRGEILPDAETPLPNPNLSDSQNPVLPTFTETCAVTPPTRSLTVCAWLYALESL